MFKHKARSTDTLVAREMGKADKAAKQADKAMRELDRALGLGTVQADVLQAYCGQRFAITDQQLARRGC